MQFQYGVPTQVCWGDIGSLRSMLEGARIYLVRGHNTLTRPPLAGKYDAIFQGLEVCIGPPVGANPTFAEVRALVAGMRAFAPDTVVAIGGGSPLDAAKAAVLVAAGGGDPADYFVHAKPMVRPLLPLIAVPTTAGTGTEVTPYAIIVDENARRKCSYTGGKLFPDKALIDPALSYSMPPYVTACTGMDAFCHALESIWAKRANPISTVLASEALRMILRHLPGALHNELAARDAMMRASLLAGMAFANAGVTAIHPASYPLTTRFGIAHGHACGLFLAPMTVFNWPVLDAACRALLLDIFGCSGLDELLIRLEDFMLALDLPTRFSQMNITAADIPEIAEHALGNSTVNNPREVTREDIARMVASRL